METSTGAFGDGPSLQLAAWPWSSLGRPELIQRPAAPSAMWPCRTGSFSGVDTLHDYRTSVLDQA
jgi:hypothetical protein